MKPLAEGRRSKDRREQNPRSKVDQLTDDRENATVQSDGHPDVDDQPHPQPWVGLQQLNHLTRPKVASEVIFEPLPQAAIVFAHGLSITLSCPASPKRINWHIARQPAAALIAAADQANELDGTFQPARYPGGNPVA
jgi:hypothetical protein